MRQKLKDQIASIFCKLALLICLGIFSWIVFDISKHGLPHLAINFFFDNPESAGRFGGIFSILVSTSLILLISIGVTLPIGLSCAIYLSEWGNEKKLIRTVLRQILEILSGVPSIVYGLFGSAFFCVYLKLGYSILAGALTLSCMLLPFFIRIVEEGFLSVPEELKTTATAMNFSKSGKIFHIVLPYTLPTIIIAIILSIGRALAETAALLFTSGYVMRTPDSILDSGRTLSVHIYDLAMNVPGGETSAYKTAFVLILFLVIINTVTSLIAKVWLKNKQGAQ